MAKEDEETSSHVQGRTKGPFMGLFDYPCPILKLLAKSDINLQSTVIDIKSRQVNALVARARGLCK